MPPKRAVAKSRGQKKRKSASPSPVKQQKKTRRGVKNQVAHEEDSFVSAPESLNQSNGDREPVFEDALEEHEDLPKEETEQKIVENKPQQKSRARKAPAQASNKKTSKKPVFSKDEEIEEQPEVTTKNESPELKTEVKRESTLSDQGCMVDKNIIESISGIINILQSNDEDLENFYFQNLKARFEVLLVEPKEKKVDYVLRMFSRLAVIFVGEKLSKVFDFFFTSCEKCLFYNSKELQRNCLIFLGRLLDSSLQIGQGKHILNAQQREKILKWLLLFSRAKESELRMAVIKGLSVVQDEPVNAKVVFSPKDALYNLLFDGEYRVRCATTTVVSLADGRFRNVLIEIALNDDQIETSCAAIKRLSTDDFLQFTPTQLYNLLAGTLLDRNLNIRKFAEEFLLIGWINQLVQQNASNPKRKATKSRFDGVLFAITNILFHLEPANLALQKRVCRRIVERILEFYHQNSPNTPAINEFIRDLLSGVAQTDVVVTNWTFKRIMKLPFDTLYSVLFLWRAMVDYVRKCAGDDKGAFTDALIRLSPSLKETASAVTRFYLSNFQQFAINLNAEEHTAKAFVLEDIINVLKVLEADRYGLAEYRKLLLHLLTNMVIERSVVELAIYEYIDTFILEETVIDEGFLTRLWGDLIFHLEDTINKWYTLHNHESASDETGAPILLDEPLGHACLTLNAMVKSRRFEKIRTIVVNTLHRYDKQLYNILVMGMARTLNPSEKEISMIYLEMLTALAMQFPDEYKAYVPVLATIATQVEDDQASQTITAQALTDVILGSSYKQMIETIEIESNGTKFDFVEHLYEIIQKIPYEEDGIEPHEEAIYECATKLVLNQPRIPKIEKILSALLVRMMHPKCAKQPYLRSMFMSFFEIFRGDRFNQGLIVDALFHFFDQRALGDDPEIPDAWWNLLSAISCENITLFATLSTSAEVIHMIMRNKKPVDTEDDVSKLENEEISAQVNLLSRVITVIKNYLTTIEDEGFLCLEQIGKEKYDLFVPFAMIFKTVNVDFGFSQHALWTLKESVDELKELIANAKPPPKLLQALRSFSRSAETRLGRERSKTKSPMKKKRNNEATPRRLTRKNGKTDKQKIKELLSSSKLKAENQERMQKGRVKKMDFSEETSDEKEVAANRRQMPRRVAKTRATTIRDI
ncbi:unnamed protein product, partial [Mesorhabditis belari]|uniref:Nuclear condensin complex subunit 3 C-terminal domain-containing protein n=1 Tax=Mesorhabditis belari TaxID=2138241 RepID=A0AAF3J1T5_9BILA